MSGIDDELIDYTILPQSKVQNYENKIEEQNSTIENLSKKVAHLESSKIDSENKVEPEPEPEAEAEPELRSEPDLSTTEDLPLPDPPETEPNRKDEKVEKPQVKEPTLTAEVKDEVAKAKGSKIIKGKNLNKECRIQQLKAKLQDTYYIMPDNIDTISSGAIGTSKKYP